MKQLPLLEEISLLPQKSQEFAVTDLLSEQIPYDAVEALLEDYLLNELTEFEPLDVEAVPVSDINCKWRFSSACQKSIRRGYVEDAIRYALTYHSVDPTGFFGRLCIVAFEDIGVADIWAVASTLAIARSKTFRQKLGGETLCVQYIIKRLAEAVKDRTVCDFFQVLENRSIVPHALATLQTATPQKLSDIAMADQEPFDSRIAAAWMLWGSDKLKNGRLPLRTGTRDIFENTIERLNVPGLVKYICLRGMISCRCAMNITYPFTWIMMEQSTYRRIVETELLEPSERFLIKGLPEETYDMHTREGLAAYRYFYKSCPAISDFLTSKSIVGNNEVVKAISVSVFIGESALLGKRLDFAGATEIYEMTVEDDYRKYGLLPDDGRILTKLILENAETLRLSRQRVVTGTKH